MVGVDYSAIIGTKIIHKTHSGGQFLSVVQCILKSNLICYNKKKKKNRQVPQQSMSRNICKQEAKGVRRKSQISTFDKSYHL